MPAGCSNTERLSGRSFSGFDIREQLGAGGMGVVYRAIDTRLGRNVALKFLSSVDSMHGEARERFLREARAASALDHPNIGAVYGIEESDDGELCIVMAYYDGETLADRLNRGPLPVEEAVRIAAAVADGLAAAHARNIIHRDIKPSNILLTSNGGVKVVDFGLATSPVPDETITQPRAVLGTAAYMSPEQARGLPTDARSDVWSLGAVLYEMLTGRRPFTGASTFVLLRSVIQDTPAPLGLGLPTLERTVLKALHKSPTHRHATMHQFATALRARGAGFSPRGVFSPAKPAAILLLLAAIYLLIPASAPKPTTLAILPFTADDDATAALARGLAESLTTRIAGLERFEGSLAVIPSADLASRRIADPETAYKNAGATVAVAGVLRRGDTGALRLDLELREAGAKDPVKTKAEDASGDAASLEQRAAGQIASLLDLRSASQLRAAAPAGKVAYQAYLRGLGYLQRWDKAGYLDNAMSAFSEAVRDNPQFALAYAGLAETARTRFRADGEPAAIQHALNYARQAVQIDAELVDAHVALGRALQDTSQRDHAVVEFKKALEADTRNSSALLGMARAYEDLGNVGESELTFRRAVSLNPYSWSARNSLAGFYIRQRRFHDAEAQYRRAIVLTPDNATLYSNLGVVLSRQNRTPDALWAFHRSIALGPTYAAHVNVGNIHYRNRNFHAAAAAYDKALQLNGRDFRVWGTKANALRLAQLPRANFEPAYREAIRLAQQALSAAPGQARTAALLAIYHACVGDRPAATRLLAQVLAQAKGDRDVQVDAATAYEILGDRASAARWTQAALNQGYPREDLQKDPDLAPVMQTR